MDQRKNSLHAVIESLAFQCTTDAERSTVQHKLCTFTRLKTETFASCFSRFESLQLDQPSEADQIRLVSYNTLRAVTPYFISTKCAQAYGKYIINQVKMGNNISKEDIIKTVTKLETYVELKLDSAKSLPSAIIDTTLNLPPGSEEHYLDAHLGDVEVVAPLDEGVPITAYLGATTVPVAT